MHICDRRVASSRLTGDIVPDSFKSKTLYPLLSTGLSQEYSLTSRQEQKTLHNIYQHVEFNVKYGHKLVHLGT